MWWKDKGSLLKLVWRKRFFETLSHEKLHRERITKIYDFFDIQTTNQKKTNKRLLFKNITWKTYIYSLLIVS